MQLVSTNLIETTENKYIYYLMGAIIKTEVSERIIKMRGVDVLLDRDVAALYGVETKRINEALRNNPDKFPRGYVFTLQHAEKQELVEKFDRFKTL